MKIRNVTREQLAEALVCINHRYDGNIIWNRLDCLNQKGTSWAVTLRCKDSRGRGHRFGICPTPNGHRRHLVAACWHVHGYLFEALLDIEPKVVIRAGGEVIDINGGNWQDRNIGSQVSPLFYSEACECAEDGTEDRDFPPLALPGHGSVECTSDDCEICKSLAPLGSSESQ